VGFGESGGQEDSLRRIISPLNKHFGPPHESGILAQRRADLHFLLDERTITMGTSEGARIGVFCSMD